MAANPFAYVPSLYTAARDIAVAIGEGKQVIALTGPYGIEDLVGEVSSLLREPSLRFDTIDTSVDLIMSGRSGLTCVRTLGESYTEFVSRCDSDRMHLVTLPVGLSQGELYGYGLALARGMSSETYRSLVLDLAAGLCGGSIDCYAHVVQKYTKAERQRFLDPLPLVREYGMAKLAQACTWRSYAKDEIKAFLSFLERLSRGKSARDADIQATYLWAWSQGLCMRFDGTWYPTWSVIQCADELDGSEYEKIANLMTETQLRRVGIAEERAMKPVIGRYCGYAVARYLAGGSSVETEGLTRASQISDVKKFVCRNASEWNSRLNDSVDMFQLYSLRCALNHLNPEGVSQDRWGNSSDIKLESFTRALAVLTGLEDMPYSSKNRSAFL